MYKSLKPRKCNMLSFAFVSGQMLGLLLDPFEQPIYHFELYNKNVVMENGSWEERIMKPSEVRVRLAE